MVLFVISLGALFVSALIGFLLVGAPSGVWLPSGHPGLYLGLLASTLILFASGIFVHEGTRRVRAGRIQDIEKPLLWALVCACAFLISQLGNWIVVWSTASPVSTGALPGGFFYVLSGLHALHVVGGLAGMVIVLVRARRGAYGPDRHGGLINLAIYWHFLEAVWIATLLTFSMA